MITKQAAISKQNLNIKVQKINNPPKFNSTEEDYYHFFTENESEK